MRALATSFVLALTPALVSGAALNLQSGSVSNSRLGFEVRHPNGWTALPVKLDERWIVAKFMSDKVFPYTDKTTGYTYEERAEMWVIRLAGGQLDPEAAFESYPDYLRATFRGGGHHVEDQGEAKARKLEATTYDVRVKARVAASARRITTWEYQLDDVRLAVHFDAPESAHGKLASELSSCLRSLKAIPRDAPAPEAEPATPAEPTAEETPRQRLERAIAREAELHERAISMAPEGWSSERVGRFLVISHDAETRGQDFAEAAGAVFDWLEESFPYIGADSYVCGPILRVCKDYDELELVKKGSGTSTWAGSGVEILACKGNWGSSSGQVDVVNQRAMEIWFRERDADLYYSFPRWLRSGLRDLIADSRTKRGKLVFKEDARDRTDLRDAVRHETLSSVQELVLKTAADFNDDDTAYEQSGVLVQFLLSKDATRKKQTKTLMADYIGHLDAVVGEIREEERKRAEQADDDEPATEEEEDALMKERQEYWKERERRILDGTFQRTFATWSERDWKTFEKAFLRSID